MQGEFLGDRIGSPDQRFMDEKIQATFSKWTNQGIAAWPKSYRISFSRHQRSALVDCLIEIRCDETDDFYARALAGNPEKSFSRALASLHELAAQLSLPSSFDDEEVGEALDAA